MGPGFVCSRGCTAAPLRGGLWFDCIDVQDLLGTVVASLAQCSGRPAGRRTWITILFFLAPGGVFFFDMAPRVVFHFFDTQGTWRGVSF